MFDTSEFETTRYGETVSHILGLAGHGARPMPLDSGAAGPEPPAEALDRLRGAKPNELFPRAFAPSEALAGLWVYFSQLDAAHRIVQELSSTEASFWHGIVHRREPDAGNAAYWFRQAGQHACFPALAGQAASIASSIPEASFSSSAAWDPFAFIDYCEHARQAHASSALRAAERIQLAEWQLLFDFCARPLD